MSDQDNENMPPSPEGEGTEGASGGDMAYQQAPDPDALPEGQEEDLREGADRRQGDKGPPRGEDDRRKIRRRQSDEGRERYLDMVQRERAMFVEQGVVRSTDQLLTAAGVAPDSQQDSEELGERDNASGDMLRSSLPVQAWLPLSIHLIGLDNAVLRIAPLHEFTDRQADALMSTVARSGFKVERIEVELWDQAELMQTLRSVHDLSADRCEKTLSQWLGDIDNGLLLNQFQRDMLAEALQMRASDIHLVQDNAPDAPNWIKYRIDGDLVPVHLLPSEAMARLSTLLKRDAGLNFGDRSTPKDGRFGFTWQGRAIDVRVAAGPQAQDGEKITMRLLDRASLKGFEELFRRNEHIGDYLAHLLSPEIKGGGGLILLSGPTGSGKTTTLYACVQKIDRRRRHVLTIEDPIEYELRYATQWQVGAVDFADLIRAAMRHDPDYIIIGEMRDGETVETSLRAAESGHTVLSTIHADSAIQTLERLRSFMPPERDRSSSYTLSQQVRIIMNQRLVKTLCHGCSHKKRASDLLQPKELQELHLEGNETIRAVNSNGCDLCGRTGILGRTLLLDALTVECNSEKRNDFYQALMKNANDVLRIEGVTLFSRQDALRGLVADGVVDPHTALVLLED